jgi:hypothetical protein
MKNNKVITKEILLKAFKRIYGQYKRNTHELRLEKCQLCRLYFDYSKYSGCTDCPMTVFKGCQGCKCMNRYCKPVNCNVGRYLYSKDKIYKAEITVVREFYRLAILKIDSIPESDFKGTIDWSFLIEIDREVSEKIK